MHTTNSLRRKDRLFLRAHQCVNKADCFDSIGSDHARIYIPVHQRVKFIRLVPNIIIG